MHLGQTLEEQKRIVSLEQRAEQAEFFLAKMTEQWEAAEDRVTALRARNQELEIRLRVSQDAQLRTYDGLAQRADQRDELLAALREISISNNIDWILGTALAAILKMET